MKWWFKFFTCCCYSSFSLLISIHIVQGSLFSILNKRQRHSSMPSQRGSCATRRTTSTVCACSSSTLVAWRRASTSHRAASDNDASSTAMMRHWCANNTICVCCCWIWQILSCCFLHSFRSMSQFDEARVHLWSDALAPLTVRAKWTSSECKKYIFEFDIVFFFVFVVARCISWWRSCIFESGVVGYGLLRIDYELVDALLKISALQGISLSISIRRKKIKK